MVNASRFMAKQRIKNDFSEEKMNIMSGDLKYTLEFLLFVGVIQSTAIIITIAHIYYGF